MNTKIEYHLREYEIAKNPADSRYYVPNITKAEKAILDIGCRIGQLFIAGGLDKQILAVGIDLDQDDLTYEENNY